MLMAIAAGAIALPLMAACGGGASGPSAADRAQETVRAFGQTAAAVTRTAFVPATPTPFPTVLPSGVVILSAKGAAPGKDATVDARTKPGATCAIIYVHPSGKISSSAGLVVKVADARGGISWTWHVSPSTEPGTGEIRVTCGGTDVATAPMTISVI